MVQYADVIASGIASYPRVSSFSIGLRPKREWEFPQDAEKAPAAGRRQLIYINDMQFAPKPQGFDVTII